MSILPSACSSVDNSCLSACNSCFHGDCSLSFQSSCSFSCESPSNCNPLAKTLVEKCQSDFPTLLCQVACSKCSTSQLSNEIARPRLATCNSSTLVTVCASKFANSTYGLSWVSLNPRNVTINYANGSIALAGTSTTAAVARNSEINLNHHSALLLILITSLL